MSLIRGDARHLPLRDGCVDTVVTSPPYFGLRDYGSADQIGLERTPDAYVSVLVAVFAEVRRVLKDTGTVWLNLGDSYCTRSVRRDDGMRSVVKDYASDVGLPTWSQYAARGRAKYSSQFAADGLKDKDLFGIPWAVAFALRDDGWYLRSDIIWHKPNPMPESVQDRPTKAHEYLFLLAKSERYYFDAAAIAEPVSDAMLLEMEQGYDSLGLKDYEAAGVQNPSSVKARIIANARRKNEQSGDRRKVGFNDRWDGKELALKQQAKGWNADRRDGGLSEIAPRGFGRNKRTVWTVPTMPYAGAHFATMPEKLVEPCILAGCQLGGLVLDPFCGTFTVGAVAARLGRRAVGVDLSYQDLAKTRTAQRGLRFEMPA